MGGFRNRRVQGTLIVMERAVPRGFAAMSFPDVAPWLDNASDDYEELPAGDSDMSYDE